MLLELLVLFVIAYAAYFLITKFLPDPINTIALAVVGIILLIKVLEMFGIALP